MPAVIILVQFERDKHLVLVDEYAIGDVSALVVRLHAVYESTLGRHTALVEPISCWDEYDLGLIFGSHAKDLDSPSVLNLPKWRLYALSHGALLAVDHGEEALGVAANDEGVVDNEREICELCVHHVLQDDLADQLVRLKIVNLDAARSLHQGAPETHENLIFRGFDSVQASAPGLNHMNRLSKLTNIRIDLVHLYNLLERATLDQQVQLVRQHADVVQRAQILKSDRAVSHPDRLGKVKEVMVILFFFRKNLPRHRIHRIQPFNILLLFSFSSLSSLFFILLRLLLLLLLGLSILTLGVIIPLE